MIGKMLGHYQISSQLGKGGMGEVYQAKDQVLGRDVAIKLLPDEFARDGDRVARFQREAKLLASLNHPNIATIHGLEEAGGKQFLVMELVEGETLADRIKRGPIPVEESLKLALQIAEALEAAHEKGVIHRDLKPANIKVTSDGKVKVLDFGLAKAFAGEQENLNLSNSPTLSNAATQQGVILGTAAYMSPEQARGKPVDKRTDIWAFGCVLFEMLSGRVAFRGEDVSEILASVIKGDVQLDLLPENLHPRVREAITRCLQMDLRRRYQGIADARYEIEQALTDPGGVPVPPVAAVEPQKKLRTMLPWLAAAVVLTAIIAGLAVWILKPTPPPEPRPVMRFEYQLPEGQQFNVGGSFGHLLAVSPDGSQFAYSTGKGLYLRSVGELDARLVPGTEGDPQSPFFSPDGKWIGYWSRTDRKLNKIAVTGGAAVALCDATWVYGAIWYADGTIVYSDVPKGVMQVSANGGNPETLIKGLTAAPQLLPDGKAVIFTDVTAQPNYRIMAQRLGSEERKGLGSGVVIRYLPTGHLVYRLDNNLYAVPFDPGKLEMKGGPVPVVEGAAPFAAISDSGTLIYRPGIVSAAEREQRTLVWVDRKGKEQPIAATANDYSVPRISPDGTKVALTVASGGEADIWIWDLIRETMTRLTFNEDSYAPLWTPDGRRITFTSGGGIDNATVYWKAADGTGVEDKLGSSKEAALFPWSWSGDGKMLILHEYGFSRGLSWDIGTLSMEGDRQWGPLLKEKYTEGQPKISPDGRWLAYTSDESGKREIYMRPFPEVNQGKWQVSTGGGDTPLWSPDGLELFYRSGDAVMAVAVQTEPAFNAGKPEVLFQGKYSGLTIDDAQPWDISPDGKRFLMMKGVQAAGAAPAAPIPRKINIVLNWFEELKQRVPTK